MNFPLLLFYLSFSHHSLVTQEIICLQCRRLMFDPWVGKTPWKREWQPTPVFLPGESYGQRSLAGYSPWNWILAANTHTPITHFQTSIHIHLPVEGKSNPRLTSSLPWALEHLTLLSLFLSWNSSSLAFAIPTPLFFLSPCGLNLILLVLRTWYFSASALLSLLHLCAC